MNTLNRNNTNNSHLSEEDYLKIANALAPEAQNGNAIITQGTVSDEDAISMANGLTPEAQLPNQSELDNCIIFKPHNHQSNNVNTGRSFNRNNSRKLSRKPASEGSPKPNTSVLKEDKNSESKITYRRSRCIESSSSEATSCPSPKESRVQLRLASKDSQKTDLSKYQTVDSRNKAKLEIETFEMESPIDVEGRSRMDKNTGTRFHGSGLLGKNRKRRQRQYAEQDIENEYVVEQKIAVNENPLSKWL